MKNKVTVWRNGQITYSQPRIMGILNVTPDSFSDGGRNMGNETEAAFQMIDEGADMIDIGGESTRPHFKPVPADVEIERVVPVVRRLAESANVPISVDTMKPEVAEAALNAGAGIINDVSGLMDRRMMDVIMSYGAAAVIMHCPQEPAKVHNTLMDDDDPMPRVIHDLSEVVGDALDAGMREESIIIDPGFGFGKTNIQNIMMLDNLALLSNRFPILAGVSRKRFLAEAFPTLSREDASFEAARIAVMNGASLLRVHDVRNTIRSLGMLKGSR